MKALRIRAEQRCESRNEFLAGQFFIVDLISDSHALRTYGLVLNISKGGMAVQTFRPLVLGRIAEIRLAFPKASLSTGAGLVAWQKEGGLAGIRFLNPPLKNLAELRQRVEQDFSIQNSDSALPLSACRSTSSTNEFDTTLQLFASSAMALTGATGAAIALGNSDGMECRASVGSAPEVGTQLNPDSGLSGHSLRTGAVNLCDDAWADSRVNIAAAQQLDTHSIVIVPITMAGTVVGLLEAFSRDTNHFDKRHVQQLQPLVNVLATVPELEPVPKKETPENVPELMPVVAAHDAGAVDNVEAVEKDAPAATHFTDYSQSTNRSRPIAIAVGILAALLVLFFAIAWFASRDRTKSLGKRNSSIATQDAVQQPSNGATVQAALNEKPVISFNPPVINRKVGATFHVDVVLKGARELWSAPVQILYDPEKLQVITVASGGLLDRDGQAAALVQRADPSEGRINLSISRPSSVPGISGDGVLFTLAFLSKASGRSRLRISQTGLRDTSAKIVSVNSSEAIVIISNSPAPQVPPKALATLDGTHSP
jgi:hypothetical protein